MRSRLGMSAYYQKKGVVARVVARVLNSTVGASGRRRRDATVAEHRLQRRGRGRRDGGGGGRVIPRPRRENGADAHCARERGAPGG